MTEEHELVRLYKRNAEEVEEKDEDDFCDDDNRRRLDLDTALQG